MERNKLNNNIIVFPARLSTRLEKAIQSFEAGDKSNELFLEFKNLSQLQVTEALFFLGCIYEDGSNGQMVDLEAAFECYEQVAHEIGYVEGYLGAARLLYFGAGVRQCYEKAFSYYERVARESGHLVAQFMLGRMLHYGHGVDKDFDAAEEWYCLSISQGSVFGMLYASILEKDRRNFIKSFTLRIKAIFYTIKLTILDKKDMRLRPR